MPNDFFRFKQFTINQGRCAMKVGTDGVLLGAWIRTEHTERILDIGTGTGLIALMLAQRSEALIDAIDIDSDAVKQAKENVQQSPWSNRIQVWCTSFQDFVKEKKNRYDLIVTNPPYFADSLKAPDEKRSLARHNHQLSQESLITGVRKLLNARGRFCVILPVANFKSFCRLTGKNGLNLSRQTDVFGKPATPCIRIMAEFSRGKGITSGSDIIIESGGRHQYSSDFRELLKAYYLKF